MILNLNSFTEKQIYVMYELYKNLEKELERKENRNDEENNKLSNTKLNIAQIEVYSAQRRSEGIRWSLTSLFQDAGMNPTLILEFYPGTESYEKYGKNLVINIEYSEDDLKHIFESIQNQSPRVTGIINFKKVPEFTYDQLNTGDIFGIQ